MGERRSGGWTRLVAAVAFAMLWLVPCAALAEPAALPLPPPGQGSDGSRAEDRARAIACLTAAIAYEAGFEPVEGQQAVAQVVLNRLRDPLYPKTVCGVVFAGSQRFTGCQFSFTCDGAMRRPISDRVLATARSVAAAVLDGAVPDRVPGATHYHASYVSPYWAPSLVRIARIGAHIFYRLPGTVDRRAGGVPLVPGGEPLIAGMAGFAGAPIAATPPAPAASVPPPPAAIFAPWGLATAGRQ